MSSVERNIESARASQQGEFQQLERAKSAEERYGREVVAHAESIKAVGGLRQQLSDMELITRDATIAAETANVKLFTSEIRGSDRAQRSVGRPTHCLCQPTDLSISCKDLVAQNTLLHNNLESVSSQAAKIRDAANSSSMTPGEGGSSDDKLAELRSVVGWLRKEKEIVELQLELSKQETTRLKTQVDHLSQSLDQAHASLSEVQYFSLWNSLTLTRHTGAGARHRGSRYTSGSRPSDEQDQRTHRLPRKQCYTPC